MKSGMMVYLKLFYSTDQAVSTNSLNQFVKKTKTLVVVTQSNQVKGRKYRCCRKIFELQRQEEDLRGVSLR